MGTITSYLNDLKYEAAKHGFSAEERVNEKTPWELLQDLAATEQMTGDEDYAEAVKPGVQALAAHDKGVTSETR